MVNNPFIDEIIIANKQDPTKFMKMFHDGNNPRFVTNQGGFPFNKAYTPKAIILGDSITAIHENYNSGPTTYTWAETRWFNVLQWKLKYPFIYNAVFDFDLGAKIGHNAGTNGDTIEQMLARLETDVISKNPDVVFIMAGTNNLANSATTYDRVVSLLTELYTRLLQRGIFVVAIPILPRRSPSDWPNSAQRLRHLKVNSWIKQYSRNVKGMMFLDLYSDVCDTSGNFLTAYSDDGLHPNALGGWVMGNSAYNQLQIIFPPTADYGLPSPIDLYDASNNEFGSIINGPFAGTGGTKTGASVLGTVPDGFTLIQTGTPVATCTASKVSRGDGKPGQAMRFRFATSGVAGANAEEFNFRTTASTATGVVAGEYYMLECDIEQKASTNGLNPFVGLSMQLIDVANGRYSIMGSNPVATAKWPDQATGIMTFRTPPFKAATSASFSAYTYMKVDNTVGADVVDIELSRMKLYRLPFAPNFN